MGIIWTLLIGFVVGVVAKFLMPGPDRGGIVVTTIIGIVGSFIGTYLGQALGLYEAGEAAGFIASVLGAMLLIFIARVVGRRP
jgi:uncharacterized membrane protein YeaQ/YmgE (transglycosylase-associated protein family)